MGQVLTIWGEQPAGMVLLSRAAAIASGQTRYFTGKPCKHGHVALRDVINCTCVECTLGWKRRNAECVREYSRQYYIENRQAQRAKSKAYFLTEAGRSAQKRARLKHREKRVAAAKRWRSENPEKAKASCANWLANNREVARRTWREYGVARWRNDAAFKLRQSLRNRINSVLKRRRKSGSAVRDLGCTMEELICHIERQFSDGMTWENWGRVWQLDHIKPLASFDLTNRAKFLEACHYSNLQPLLVEDHKKKTLRDRRSLLMAA